VSRVGEIWLNHIDPLSVCDVDVPLSKMVDLKAKSSLDADHLPLAAQIAWSFDRASRTSSQLLVKFPPFRDDAFLLSQSQSLLLSLLAGQVPDGDAIQRFSSSSDADELSEFIWKTMTNNFETGLAITFGGFGLAAVSGQGDLDHQMQLARSSTQFDRTIAGMAAGHALGVISAVSRTGRENDKERNRHAFTTGERIRPDGESIAGRKLIDEINWESGVVNPPACAAINARFAWENDPDSVLPFYRQFGEFLRTAYLNAGLFDQVRRTTSSRHAQAAMDTGDIGYPYRPIWHSGGVDTSEGLVF
jgi:hypothetical protein